jgi:dTMP kinase
MKGRFITIEGCEGVGKSTLLAGLKKYLLEAGIDAEFTREPGGTPVAEKIRAVILDANNAEMTDKAELMLYAAARAQHTEEKILPKVKEGKLVICDRYSDSTLAYQGYARGIDKELIRSLNKIAECGVKIDATIFLDLDPEKGFLRKGGADKSDRLEKETLDFHKRVYGGFKEIAKAESERVISIDASKSASEVLEEVISQLKMRGIV